MQVLRLRPALRARRVRHVRRPHDQRAGQHVVKLETDDGLVGYGETCPLGADLPARATRPAPAPRSHELAPALIGVDPRNLGRGLDALDGALAGHDYAKAAIDIACWDLLGQAAGVPVSTLLGGVTSEDFPLYVAIPLGPVEQMVAHVRDRRAEGIRRFQLKLGADPREDAARVRAVLEATDGGRRRSSPTPTAAGACRTRRSPPARSRASTACSSSSPARRSRSA